VASEDASYELASQHRAIVVGWCAPMSLMPQPAC